MAEKGKAENPEIQDMLTEAARLRPPPAPKKAEYKSRTMSRIASRSKGKAVPGRGLIRAESKATLNSKKVINKFESMLSTAESEEAKRLAALKEAEENRKKELELIAAREAQDVELARVRLEEEKRNRIEEKKKKMLEEEAKEKARLEAGEKMRQRIEAEKAKEKHRKEAAELAIRQAKEERAAKEAAEKAEAEQLAALKSANEETEARRKAQEEADAKQLADQLTAETLKALELEEKKEAERLKLIRQAEEELLALEKAEKEEEMKKEAEQLRQEAARLAAQLEEEQRRRNEVSIQNQLQKQLDDDAAAKSRYEADKARADAEKAVADAEKAKADAERAKADAEIAKAELAKAKADLDFSRRKAEILEQAARIRQQEAEDARERRAVELKLQERRLSFDQQRLDIEEGLTRAEMAAQEKKEAWKAAQMQAEVESMRLKLEAVEEERARQLETTGSSNSVSVSSPKKSQVSHLSQVVDLTASSHAGLSLRRLNERARMSQRSISAAQGVQKHRLHNFVKTQSMPDPDHRFGAFASDSPSDRGVRHSIGSPQGRVPDGRFDAFQNPVLRHSFDGGETVSSNSRRRWDKLRTNILSPNGQLHGQDRLEEFSRKSYTPERIGYGNVEANSEPRVKKSVSMKLPSPPTSLLSPTPTNSSSPRASNRYLNKSSNMGHVSEPTSSVVTPPPPVPLDVMSGGPSTGGTDNSGSSSNYNLTPNSTKSDQFSPGINLDLHLDVDSPNPDPPTSKEEQEQGYSRRSGRLSGGIVSPEKDQSALGQNNDVEQGDNLTPAMRLANKKKAEADRVKARRQAEAKNFEKRKVAAEAVALQDHKKLQAEELAKIMYLEKVIDHATSERVKVEAEESARVKAAKAVIDAANMERAKKEHGYVEHNGTLTAEEKHEQKVSPSNSIEEKKSNSDHEQQQQEQEEVHSSSARPPMAPRVKSLVLGDFSIRHLPMKTSSSNLLRTGSSQSVHSESKTKNVEKVMDMVDDSSDSDVASVHSAEEMNLDSPSDDAVSSAVLKKRFSSASNDDRPRSFEENKSIDSPSLSTSRRFSGDKTDISERQRRFQNGSSSSGGSNNNSNHALVKKSLSSQNHVHKNSAARLGDLLINEGAKSSLEMFELENMVAFDDLFGKWIKRESKLQPHESLPKDHLEAESSLDKYIEETLRRGSEINWRLGQLEGKVPHPEGIHSIRKLLNAKIQTLKKVRDRKADGINLSSKELNGLRDELHDLRNMCLDAIDRERIRLDDPEHILQEEFDLIADL